MNSQDGSMRPSEALAMFGGKIEKPKRRRVSRKKSEQRSDTHTKSAFTCHPSVSSLSREERILLYMKRAEEGKNNKKPVNIFTGELYSKEVLDVVDDGTGDEWIKSFLVTKSLSHPEWVRGVPPHAKLINWLDKLDYFGYTLLVAQQVESKNVPGYNYH